MDDSSKETSETPLTTEGDRRIHPNGTSTAETHLPSHSLSHLNDPQQFIANIEIKREELLRLNDIAREHSLLVYGKITSESELLDAQKIWNIQMSEWAEKMKHIDPILFKQMEAVAKHVYIRDSQGEPADQIDWIAFYKSLYKPSGAGPVETFVGRLKTMPGIKENIKGMEELSRIFGEEARASLFGIEIPYAERRREESKKIIEKSFKEGELDEKKYRILLEKINLRADNEDYQVSCVEIDSKFTAEEKKRIQDMLRNIPKSLRKNIKRVNRLLIDNFAAGTHGVNLLSGSSEIGLNPKYLSKTDAGQEHSQNNFAPEGVFYHEVIGHALRYYISKTNKEVHHALNNILTGVPHELLLKDPYAKRYIDDDSELKKANVPRNGISAEVDEFWANRMAEYWGRRNNQAIQMHRDYDLPFTDTEQRYIDEVCEKIVLAYTQASGDKI